MLLQNLLPIYQSSYLTRPESSPATMREHQTSLVEFHHHASLLSGSKRRQQFTVKYWKMYVACLFTAGYSSSVHMTVWVKLDV
jgi:hypothetical protein